MSLRPTTALAMLLGLAIADMGHVAPEPASKRDEDEPDDRPRKLTAADEERIAAAQAKRERRAAKRRATPTRSPTQ